MGSVHGSMPALLAPFFFFPDRTGRTGRGGGGGSTYHSGRAPWSGQCVTDAVALRCHRPSRRRFDGTQASLHLGSSLIICYQIAEGEIGGILTDPGSQGARLRYDAESGAKNTRIRRRTGDGRRETGEKERHGRTKDERTKLRTSAGEEQKKIHDPYHNHNHQTNLRRFGHFAIASCYRHS